MMPHPISKIYLPVSGYLKNQITSMPEFYYNNMPDFDIHEYKPLIDSSDITVKNWITIAEDIKQNYDKYDGFVILHGTDTMAFTSSALSFIFENLTKPVILTGSQIPLSELRTDGKQNLLNAIYIAAYYPINEVSLFFNNRLLRGNRAVKVHTDCFSPFISPNFEPLLKIGVDICYHNQIKHIVKNQSKSLIVHNMKSQPIHVLTLYPGIAENTIENFSKTSIKALILRSYGMGNVPQNINFINKIKEFYNHDIIIINLTQCTLGKVNMNCYLSGDILKKIGVINGLDLTIEAAITKLYFLLSQNFSISQIRSKMQRNLRGELTEENC